MIPRRVHVFLWIGDLPKRHARSDHNEVPGISRFLLTWFICDAFRLCSAGYMPAAEGVLGDKWPPQFIPGPVLQRNGE